MSHLELLYIIWTDIQNHNSAEIYICVCLVVFISVQLFTFVFSHLVDT